MIIGGEINLKKNKVIKVLNECTDMYITDNPLILETNNFNNIDIIVIRLDENNYSLDIKFIYSEYKVINNIYKFNVKTKKLKQTTKLNKIRLSRILSKLGINILYNVIIDKNITLHNEKVILKYSNNGIIIKTITSYL